MCVVRGGGLELCGKFIFLPQMLHVHGNIGVWDIRCIFDKERSGYNYMLMKDT